MKCLTCNNEATQRHHVIPKSQGGTDNPENLAPLCFEDHFEIHHGIHTARKQEILKVCYDFIKPNLSKCWAGKIKPKVVNMLENT